MVRAAAAAAAATALVAKPDPEADAPEGDVVGMTLFFPLAAVETTSCCDGVGWWGFVESMTN